MRKRYWVAYAGRLTKRVLPDASLEEAGVQTKSAEDAEETYRDPYRSYKPLRAGVWELWAPSAPPPQTLSKRLLRKLREASDIKVLDIDVNSFREHHYLTSFHDKSNADLAKTYGWMLHTIIKKINLVLEGRSSGPIKFS